MTRRLLTLGLLLACVLCIGYAAPWTGGASREIPYDQNTHPEDVAWLWLNASVDPAAEPARYEFPTPNPFAVVSKTQRPTGLRDFEIGDARVCPCRVAEEFDSIPPVDVRSPSRVKQRQDLEEVRARSLSDATRVTRPALLGSAVSHFDGGFFAVPYTGTNGSGERVHRYVFMRPLRGVWKIVLQAL